MTLASGSSHFVHYCKNDDNDFMMSVTSARVVKGYLGGKSLTGPVCFESTLCYSELCLK